MSDKQVSEVAYNKPIPKLDDPLMGPFWQGTRDHRLLAQHCTHCQAWHFPALPICPTCLEQALEWQDVTPEGTIWSYAIYHRAFHPGFKGELPYVVAIVDTPEGVRYTGRIDAPRDKVQVGARVKVVFADVTDAFTLPMWTLAEKQVEQ